MSAVLAQWRRLNGHALGRWLFARLVCWRAPYFASIRPRLDVLEPGLARARVRRRRAVTNHIGTVHAIALCNLAEFCAGLLTEVSIPADMRWIPKGMRVEYLKKASGDVRGEARIEPLPTSAAQGYELVVPVAIHDARDELVFRASITMWIAPRKSD